MSAAGDDEGPYHSPTLLLASNACDQGPGHVDVIGLLVELGARLKPATDDRNVETPLHIAARAGRKDIVLKLIKHGAAVSSQTKDGSTPLHYAAAFGQAHVIDPLVKAWQRPLSMALLILACLQAGCSVHSRDNAQNTPLHLAAGCGFLDAVVKLVELGADLNARDMSECTPLQNTAHGTYSALAHVPSGVTAGSNGNLQAGSAPPLHSLLAIMGMSVLRDSAVCP